MDDPSGSLNFQNMGRWTALPQGTQFPDHMPPSLTHFNLNNVAGSSRNPRPTWGQMPTQSTSSESPLIEELPSWFEELLNEPDTPGQRGHRRSNSDSFAYFSAEAKTTNTSGDHNKLIGSSAAWPDSGPASRASSYTRSNSSDKFLNMACESSLNCLNNTSDLLLRRDQPNRINVLVLGSAAPAPEQPDGVPPKAIRKQDCAESSSHNQEGSSERSDCCSLSKSDAKRAKQQFAQRSRIRKIQYIAELEMSVQALQAEGCEISAAVEYLDQHNLILGMKNLALQQRLENLSHEYLIKQLEQDMLEREIRRLQALYQQQQQQQQLSGHRRAKSRNLDSPFSNSTFVKI